MDARNRTSGLFLPKESRSMKIVVAMMKHETNTFSPVPVSLSDFGPGGPMKGKEAYDEFRHSALSTAGLLEVAESAGASIDFPIAARATPSGAVPREAFDTMTKTLCDAVRRDCDALFLDLHGVMVTEDYDDGEGELLERVRRLRPDLPIAVALDMHGNISERMVANCTTLVSCKTIPHTDMVEAGRRAGQLLLEAMAGRIHPVMVYERCPILPNMLRVGTGEPPMSDLAAAAREWERKGALAVNVFSGFPMADTPDTSMSVVTMTDGSVEQAKKICHEICTLAWERRHAFKLDFEPLEKSIARAKSAAGGPVLLVDLADNCNSGAGQDTMTVIEEALRQGLEDIAAGPICDPVAVQGLIEAGIGSVVTLPIGNKLRSREQAPQAPLVLTGRVKTISDGRFVIRGPVFTGTKVALGRTAVLDTGKLTLIVSERRTEPLDLAMFRIAAIEPTDHRYIIIKSKMNYRPTYGAMAKHVIECNGTGSASPDLNTFQFRKIRRPIFPLDEMESL
jgi:microcystin degradation protein MlrC